MNSLKDLVQVDTDDDARSIQKSIQANKAALSACARRLEWKIANGQQKQVRQLMNRKQRLIDKQGVLIEKLSVIIEKKERKNDQERTEGSVGDAPEGV